MTSKERVIKAVTFAGPDRVPVHLPAKWGTDIIGCWSWDDPDFKPRQEGEDEWGCVWEKRAGDKTMGQVKGHPLTDYAMLDDYPFPDFTARARYEPYRKAVKENREEKFILAGVDFQLMHRLEYLRGHDNAWTDYLVNPDGLCRLLDILADKAIDQLTHLAEIGVDGMITADDWGFQDRLMLPPEVFHEFFKPRYGRVYEFARDKGIITMLHSCGKIVEILDGLREASLQVIQMDQQQNMGIKELAAGWGGKLCFYCPVDIQKMMVNGSLDEIRAYARKLIDSFAAYNGGFIAKWYDDPEAAGHSMEKVDAMSDEFVSYGAEFYSG